MLRTRLWMGALLIGLAVLLLLEDRWFAPWYPILFVCYAAGSLLATRELLSLHPVAMRPSDLLVLVCILLMVVVNWWSAFLLASGLPTLISAWDLIGVCVVA